MGNIELISANQAALSQQLFANSDNSQAQIDGLSQFYSVTLDSAVSEWRYYSHDVVQNRIVGRRPVASANNNVLNIWRPEDEARVRAAIAEEERRIAIFEERLQTTQQAIVDSIQEATTTETGTTTTTVNSDGTQTATTTVDTAAAADTGAAAEGAAAEAATTTETAPAAAPAAPTGGNAVVEGNKDGVFALFETYDPIEATSLITFSDRIDITAIRNAIREEQDFHRDSDRKANAGAIAAVIVGSIILVGLLGYCLWKACMMKKSGEMSSAQRGGRQGTVLVNQSAISSNTQGKLDDIM